jgi:hypothetical protein
MTLGAWRRHGSPPTVAEMAAGIRRERRPLWLSLTNWLADTYGLSGELTWADEDSGWVLRYRRNGRALATLSPYESGGFGALVVVGPTVVEPAFAAPLSEMAREALAFATPYADGRWLWLKVTEPAVVEDVKTLIRLKAPPPRRPLGMPDDEAGRPGVGREPPSAR